MPWHVGESAILDAAYGYAESSPAWRIFPMAAGAKKPAIRTGTDHAEHSSTDAEVILGWYRRGLLEAIGMPTGWPTGTIVIDVDAKHDGEALLAELEHPDVLGPLPRTKVVRTRSGGLHIYCARPPIAERIASGAKDGQLAKLLGRQGVDVRADGGEVVLPPSKGYRWIADDDGPLPELPARWLAALLRAGEPPLPMPTTSPIVSDELRVRRARAYLARMPASISGEGGHDALWAAAVALVRGFDLDAHVARSILLADFNPRCTTDKGSPYPWSERDIDHKLDGATRSRLARGYLLDGDRT